MGISLLTSTDTWGPRGCHVGTTWVSRGDHMGAANPRGMLWADCYLNKVENGKGPEEYDLKNTSHIPLAAIGHIGL